VSALLLLRAALNVLAGGYFVAVRSSDAAQNFQQSGVYLVLDALFALAIPALAFRAPNPAWLRALVAGDAVMRLAFGLWFLLVPGLQSFVTTRIFVLVLVCIVAALLGFAGLWSALRLRSASAWPIIVASAALVVYAIALFRVFPDAAGMRMLLGVYLLIFGAALLGAGLRPLQLEKG
jgi:uncharacterized membrane protein HdeD (DUF308 family)